MMLMRAVGVNQNNEAVVRKNQNNELKVTEMLQRAEGAELGDNSLCGCHYNRPLSCKHIMWSAVNIKILNYSSFKYKL